MTRVDSAWSVTRLFVGAVVLATALPIHASICINDTTSLHRVRGVVLTSDVEDLSLLPGTRVHLRRGQFEVTSIADEHGYFSFPQVRPGEYELEAELEGFLSAYADLRVRKGAATRQVLVIDMTFEIEGCSWVRTTPWREAQALQLKALKSSDERMSQ